MQVSAQDAMKRQLHSKFIYLIWCMVHLYVYCLGLRQIRQAA